MLKDCSLKEVEDLSARASHDPILYENSTAYKTKMAVHGDKRKQKKDKPMNRLVLSTMQLTYTKMKLSHYFIFLFQFCRIRKRCQHCLKQGRKETKTQYCCAQCGDVPLCMQEDIRNSCWTNWHKTVYEGLSKKKNN